MQLRVPGNRIVKAACLIAFVLLLAALLFLTHSIAGGAQALISTYHGAQASNVLPNVVSNYRGLVAIISGYHGIHSQPLIVSNW